MPRTNKVIDISELGVWTIRIALVGAIVAGCLGKSEVSEGCVSGLIISFFLL